LLRASVAVNNGQVHLASRYPYGNHHLQKLICESAGKNSIVWRFLQKGFRGFPIAEFGKDDGKCPIHYFIAGEDVWETAGSWVADGIIRELSGTNKVSRDLVQKGVIRIVPLVSPYSAAADNASYCNLEGKGVYGAATWD